MFRSEPPAPLPSRFVSRTVLKHVYPAPLRDAALLVLIFHVVFVTRGPWLSFSLYSAITDPGENYRQQSQYIVSSFSLAEREPLL